MREVTSNIYTRQRRVAFFAGLNLNIESMPMGERAIMNNTVTNVGKAYDPEKGQVGAPVDGVYSFIVAISAQGRKQVRRK